MEESKKPFTTKSLMDLIKKDPDRAFAELQHIDDKEYFGELMAGISSDAYDEMLNRSLLANLEFNIANKTPTP